MEDSGSSHRAQNERLTTAILVSAVAVVVAWDLVLVLRGGPTESRMIADLSVRWTTLPLSVGILAGHWFWHASAANRPYLLAVVVGAFLAWDFSLLLRGGTPAGIEADLRNPVLPLLTGIAVGRLLWAQR